MSSIVSLIGSHAPRYLRMGAPIVADLICYQLFHKVRSKETAFFLIGPLAAGTTRFRVCERSDWKFAAVAYAAYKVIQYFMIYNSDKKKPARLRASFIDDLD